MSVQFQRNPQQIVIEPNLDDGQQHLQGPGRVSLSRSVSREERSERIRIKRIFDKVGHSNNIIKQMLTN